MTMDRLQRLKYILGHDSFINDYYLDTYGISEVDFTYDNVMDYSPGGLGELADCILDDGNYLFKSLQNCDEE